MKNKWPRQHKIGRNTNTTMQQPRIQLTQYQRFIEGMMHTGIALVVTALFLKVLVL